MADGQTAEDSAAAKRVAALQLMGQALGILDRVGPLQAAAMLAFAIEQAGGTVAMPPDD